MKKLAHLVFLGALGTFALADWDIAGQITAIDPVNHTITLNGNAVIQILPYTKLKGDDCGIFWNDTYGTFADLEVGKFVEAEVYPSAPAGAAPQAGAGGAQFVAQEVEWKCYGWMDRKRAY